MWCTNVLPYCPILLGIISFVRWGKRWGLVYWLWMQSSTDVRCKLTFSLKVVLLGKWRAAFQRREGRLQEAAWQKPLAVLTAQFHKSCWNVHPQEKLKCHVKDLIIFLHKRSTFLKRFYCLSGSWGTFWGRGIKWMSSKEAKGFLLMINELWCNQSCF